MRALEDYGRIIAILRGVEPDEVLDVADILVEAGIDIIEVPFNSPEPMQSVARLAEKYGDAILIGAGTVLTPSQVLEVKSAGGRLIVSPNADPDVIKTTKEEGLISAPGVYTPSEAFAAIFAGADALKLFPASAVGSHGLKAMKAVLPPNVPVFAVGGIGPDNMAEFAEVGVAGFGLGSNLFTPGLTLPEVRARADKLRRSADSAFASIAD